MLSRLKTKRDRPATGEEQDFVLSPQDLSPRSPSPSPSLRDRVFSNTKTTPSRDANSASASTTLLVPAEEQRKPRSLSFTNADRRSINLSMPDNIGSHGRGRTLTIGGPGSDGSGLTVGEGSLSFDQIAGTSPSGGGGIKQQLHIVPPSLIASEPSPIIPSPSTVKSNGNGGGGATRRPAIDGEYEDEDDVHLRTPMPQDASTRFDLNNDAYNGTASPAALSPATSPAQSPRARSTTVSSLNFPPTGRGVNGNGAPSSAALTASLSGGSLASLNSNGTSSAAPSVTSTTSRPGSRSASVNSQQGPDFLAPRPVVRMRSSSRDSTKKERKAAVRVNSGMSGIAGALALSGVALASPSTGLRQPMPLVRQGSYQNPPGNSSSQSGAPGALPLGRDSTEIDSSDGHSMVLGGEGLLSMDTGGDFDDVVSQLGTGYAVASSKRNADFHTIFKNIPDDDYLIEDYGCALQREILIQGRLYISEHHLSFNANIFGWVTTHTLPFAEIVSIEKRMTAYVIPNAIQVTTLHARYTFASFLSRDTTYDLIGSIWRMVHPVVPPAAGLPDSATSDTEDDDTHSLDSRDVDEPEPAPSEAPSSKRSGIKRLVGKGRRRGDTSASNPEKSTQSSNGRSVGAAGGVGSPRLGSGRLETKVHPVTEDTCATLKNLTIECLDTVFPSAPEKIYNLIFTSGFMRDFWVNNQKLTELDISDWAPDEKTGSNLLTRKVEYIKPLNSSVGPKSAKCIIVDESEHVDFDDFVCIVTTTQTPEVPLGKSFSVKTRTSMTWAKGNSCRLRVTTGIEWASGNLGFSAKMLKGVIEKSCIDGQKTYHEDLEKAMRAYIHAHRSEFLEEGQDEEASPPVASLENVSTEILRRKSLAAEAHAAAQGGTQGGAGENESGVRALVSNVVGTIGELLDGMSPTTAVLAVVVAVLVLSNVWTLMSRSGSSGAAGSSGRIQTSGPTGVRGNHGGHRNPDEIALAVRGVLHDYFADHPRSSSSSLGGGGGDSPTTVPVGESIRSELDDLTHAVEELDPTAELSKLTSALDAIEARVLRLRVALEELPGTESD